MAELENDIILMKQKFPNYSSRKPTVNLKRLLTLKFPGTKFSVKLSKCHGEMYKFVDVKWNDGPFGQEVAIYCNRFRAGDFSSMGAEDPYYKWHPADLWRTEFGEVEIITYDRQATVE